MNKNLTALSIFCLALSIVIGSWIISNSLNKNRMAAPVQTSAKSTKTLLTESELAAYLGVSIEVVRQLGPITDSSTGDITSALPYIKVGDLVYYPKAGIDRWLTNPVGATLP